MKKLLLAFIFLLGMFFNICAYAANSPLDISIIYGGIYNNKMIVFFNIKTPDGIKTYWKNPGFGGIAPEFIFDKTQNINNIKMIYNVPAIVTKQGITNYTLKQNDYIALSFLPEDPSMPVTFKGVLNYGYCDTLCKADKFKFNKSFSVDDTQDNKLLSDFFATKPVSLTPDMPIIIKDVEGFYNVQKNLLLSFKIEGIQTLDEDRFVYYFDTDFEINKPMIRKTDADKYQISIDLLNMYQKPKFLTLIFPDNDGQNIISKQKIFYKSK